MLVRWSGHVGIDLLAAFFDGLQHLESVLVREHPRVPQELLAGGCPGVRGLVAS